MGVPQIMLALNERVGSMKESLQKSQTTTDNMISILGSFDHRLSALETAMRPTQIRTHSIRRAHENIDRTLKSADVILGQFDLSRKVLNFNPNVDDISFTVVRTHISSVCALNWINLCLKLAAEVCPEGS